MSTHAHILKSKGYRVTPARVRLLALLSRAGKPLSVKEIVERLKGKSPSPDMVTLYRALESFAKVGLVTRADLGRGGTSYEYAPEKEHHHHLVCMKCKRIEDFIGCDHESLVQKALTQTRAFHAVQSHSIELFGWCHACIKSNISPV